MFLLVSPLDCPGLFQTLPTKFSCTTHPGRSFCFSWGSNTSCTAGGAVGAFWAGSYSVGVVVPIGPRASPPGRDSHLLILQGRGGKRGGSALFHSASAPPPEGPAEGPAPHMIRSLPQTIGRTNSQSGRRRLRNSTLTWHSCS